MKKKYLAQLKGKWWKDTARRIKWSSPHQRPESWGEPKPVEHPKGLVVRVGIHKYQDGSHPGEKSLVEAEIVRRGSRRALLRRLDNGDYFTVRNEQLWNPIVIS